MPEFRDTDSKPWESRPGKHFPRWKLKRISRHWKPQVWQEYARSLETPLKEKLGRKVEIRDLVEKAEVTEKNWNISRYRRHLNLEQARQPYDRIEEEEEADPRHELLRQALREALTPIERTIIEKYYWDGLSEPKIAIQIDRHRSTVQTLKRRAEQKLKSFLSSILPIVEETLPKRKRFLYFLGNQSQVECNPSATPIGAQASLIAT